MDEIKTIRIDKKEFVLAQKDCGHTMYIDQSGTKSKEGDFISDDGRYVDTPYFQVEGLTSMEVKSLWHIIDRLNGGE